MEIVDFMHYKNEALGKNYRHARRLHFARCVCVLLDRISLKIEKCLFLVVPGCFFKRSPPCPRLVMAATDMPHVLSHLVGEYLPLHTLK